MKKIKKMMGIFAALLMAFAVLSCANGSSSDDSKKEKEKEPVKVELSDLASEFEGTYYFKFTGDYGLEDLVAADLRNDQELTEYLETAIPTWLGNKNNKVNFSINVTGAGCCSIAAENAGEEGGQIYGRNFDYDNDHAVIVHTKPAEGKGYESISTSYTRFFTGYTKNWTPTGDQVHDAAFLGAIYVPMDGLNEKGLYVSVLDAGDKEKTDQNDSSKHKVQTTVAVRYLLDKADTVEKAIELLEGVNMYNVYNTAYHFAIADNTGKSVVVEYIGNEMKVEDAKVVTNHYLVANSGKPAPASNDSSILRFNTAKEAGEKANWKMTAKQMRDTLKAASAKQYNTKPDSKHITVWSAVYEPNAKKITYYFREDFSKYVEVTF